MRKISPIALCGVAALILTGCASLEVEAESEPAVLTPAEAEASYLKLADRAFPNADTPGKIAAAEGICMALADDNSRTVVERTIAEASGSALTPSEVTEFVSLATGFKCPELAED